MQYFKKTVIFTVKWILLVDWQLNFATFSIKHNFRNIWNMDLWRLFARIFPKMFDETYITSIFSTYGAKIPPKYWYHSMHSPSVLNNQPSSIKKYQIDFKLFVRFNDLFLYIFGGSTIATYMKFAISQKMNVYKNVLFTHCLVAHGEHISTRIFVIFVLF